MDLNGDGATFGIETVLIDIVALSILIGAISVIWKKVLKPMFKNTRSMIKRTNQFLDDWYGDEASPGVMLRISSLEEDRTANTETLALVLKEIEQIKHKVSHELNRNGGSSTKDAAFEALRIVRLVQMQQEEEIQERRYLVDQMEQKFGVSFGHEKPDTPSDTL